jgi:hypothetical protein
MSLMLATYRAFRARLALSPAGRVTAAGAGALLVLVGSALAARPALPLPRGVPEDEAQRLRQVAEHATVAGRVTGEAFLARPSLFEYLLDHPELASHLIRALRVNFYRVWREPDGLWVDDGGGAVGRFWIVHAANGSRVLYLRGRYKQGILPAIHGQAVAVLDYVEQPAADGKSLITPTLTGFVKIDNALVEMLSKLLSSVAATKAERLARRLVGDFAKTARAINEDPAHVHDELRRRPDVPRRDLEEFRRLLGIP